MSLEDVKLQESSFDHSCPFVPDMRFPIFALSYIFLV